MSSLGYTTHVLASAVADSGTVAIAYPTGTSKQILTGSTGGKLAVEDGAYGSWSEGAGGFTVAYGASTITITNDSGVTWPAGAEINVSFGSGPRNGSYNVTLGDDANQAMPGDGSGRNDIQELTASGAVTPGVRILELNHATVAIAATLADPTKHQGLFIVRDTSASGTAAHTVTLAAGTWDGTNDVITLNAPGEEIIVHFDSVGRGTIIQNTGAVALS